MTQLGTKHLYLAGPITGISYEDARLGWREEFPKLLQPHIECYSPMRGKDFLKKEMNIGGSPDAMNNMNNAMASPSGILTRDFNDVLTCDAMVANFIGAQRVSIGTCVEFGFAYSLRKPVVMICESKDNPHYHAFLTEIAGYVVSSMKEAAPLVNFLLTPGV